MTKPPEAFIKFWHEFFEWDWGPVGTLENMLLEAFEAGEQNGFQTAAAIAREYGGSDTCDVPDNEKIAWGIQNEVIQKMADPLTVSVPVKVKQLVWKFIGTTREDRNVYETVYAASLRQYKIVSHEPEDWWGEGETWFRLYMADDVGPYPSLEAAKDAAQRHYENFVKSALEVSA